jgi:hypothetical protein
MLAFVNVNFAQETEITYQGLGQYKVTFSES